MRKITAFLTLIILFISCKSDQKSLKEALGKQFPVPVDVEIQAENIIVLIDKLPLRGREDYYLNDYTVTSMVASVFNTLGRVDFLDYGFVRVDVSSLRKSFTFPTREYIKGVEKLSYIDTVTNILNQEDFSLTKKLFDEAITKELLEEQILKEWNELYQWHGPEMAPEMVGFKMFQLPTDLGYYFQIGTILINRSGEKAFVEFSFSSETTKLIGINITYI